MDLLFSYFTCLDCSGWSSHPTMIKEEGEKKMRNLAILTKTITMVAAIGVDSIINNASKHRKRCKNPICLKSQCRELISGPLTYQVTVVCEKRLWFYIFYTKIIITFDFYEVNKKCLKVTYKLPKSKIRFFLSKRSNHFKKLELY